MLTLKVPKCEIFDRSDFPDFYTIKSSRVGGKKKKISTFQGSFRGAKFLTRMLSLFLRRFFLSLGPKIFFSYLASITIFLNFSFFRYFKNY
jgi:hypothetical protein